MTGDSPLTGPRGEDGTHMAGTEGASEGGLDGGPDGGLDGPQETPGEHLPFFAGQRGPG